MSLLALDPALSRLLRYQATARWRRAVHSWRSPRRLICTLLALNLGMVWIGQTVAASLFRVPADPANMQRYITSGLLAYAIWIVVKIVFRKPVEPWEWTPAEQEWLQGAPLARVELIKFRMAQIGGATLAKSFVFVVVMWADLRVLPCAVLGIAAALVSIDLIRMAGEMAVYGLSENARRKLQCSVGAIVVAALTSSLVTTLCSEETRQAASGIFRLPLAFAGHLGELQDTLVGHIVRWPFDLLARTVLARELWTGLQYLAIDFSLLAGLAYAVICLDRAVLLRCRRREQIDALRRSDPLTSTPTVPAGKLFVPWFGRGAGAIAWRQWRGAVHYRLALILPLLIAGALSLFPLLGQATGLYLWAQIVGSLVFYSFVLLPPALRFDFRRDVDRMVILKSLPASPSAVVAGQLAVPVILCVGFQGSVLLVASVFQPVSPWLLASMLLLLLPVTLFIFVVENLVYLLYPYRLNQEGLSVFVRSILVFTGKSVLFGSGVVASIGMLFVAQRLANWLWPSDPQTGLALFFGAGMWLLLGAVLGCCGTALVRIYHRFDVSCDGPSRS